jgi:hypothetical protein
MLASCSPPLGVAFVAAPEYARDRRRTDMLTLLPSAVVLLAGNWGPSLLQVKAEVPDSIRRVANVVKARVLACCVTKGMSPEQVGMILGPPDTIFGGIGHDVRYYLDFVVEVSYSPPFVKTRPEVEDVQLPVWTPCTDGDDAPLPEFLWPDTPPAQAPPSDNR